MNNIEKNKFKIQLYENIMVSISDCLKDLDNKRQVELLLSTLQGYFNGQLNNVLNLDDRKELSKIDE